MPDTLLASLSSLAGLRMAVVGDLMLDQFVLGRVDRISPEAPVPVVHVNDDEARLGGAANVAANVASLGLSVELFGARGPGDVGDHLVQLAEEHGVGVRGIIRCDERVTTVKTRILGGGQQIVRIDRETREALLVSERTELLSRFRESGPFDVIVISDYGKGVIGDELMDEMRAVHDGGVPVICDPKQADFRIYRGTTCITPNAREAGSAVHSSVHDDESATQVAGALLDRLGTDMILLTRGEQGMTLFESDAAVAHLPTHATEVYDVTGAGDTVIATFSALLGTGLGAAESARGANLAAGIVIRELGTAVITTDDLRRAAESGATR